MAFMYCKLFASLYQGTLRGKPHEILVFTNMLAHADVEGCVDKHFRAIADEVGLSVDEVKAAIACLEGPDDESRSPEMEGRRIVRVNDSRAWGWRVVNYGKYRAIKNDEDRRESNRKAQEKWRDKQKKLKLGISDDKQSVSDSNHESSQSAQEEVDAEEEGKEEVEEMKRVVMAAPIPPTPQKAKRVVQPANDEEWLKTLETDPTYAGIDVRRELGKMQQWCLLKHKQPSRARFLNWIGRIDKPLVSPTIFSSPLSDEQNEIGSWFGREAEDWKTPERMLWNSLPMVTKDHMKALRWLYTESGHEHLRQSLGSLLANWQAELDKANTFNPDAKKK